MFEGLPDFLTVEEAAKALRIGRSKSYELTVEWDRSDHTSGLPFVWFGNQKRIPRDALVRYIEDQLGPRAA